MPRVSKIPETTSGWEAVWALEYQALFRSLSDFIVLHSDDEQDGVVDLTDPDASYPLLDHYRTLAIVLCKYSILLPPEDGSAGHTATTYRRGSSFLDNPTPADTDLESRFHQRALYDICKHVSTLCHTASADELVSTDELASSVTGRYGEKEALETFLSVLEDYMLLRQVDPEEHNGGDIDTPVGDRADTFWVVGLQRSVNKDRTRGTP